MPNGPDPHGDFVITAERIDYSVENQGADRPIEEGEADRIHEPGSGPVSGDTGEESTADTLQPAAPLSVRFRSQEHGK
jgi:hypothetical protein